MRHLLNAENSTPEVDSRAPENASSEMCSMKLPRHTERSYAQEVKSKSLLVSTIPSYRIFSEGQVPFKHVESLGRGNLALIDKVEHTTADATPGKAYARKILPASRVQNARDLLEALEASKTLCHQHIVTIILTYEEVGPQKRNFGIIMEPIAENNLQDYLEELHESGKCMEPNNQTMLRKWFGCLASVLAYTHAKEIRHENIQPSNILVKDNEIFFASFGVSKHFRSDDIAGEATGRPDAQHAAYVAPEVESDRPQNFKADIFSLGCVYLDILTVIAGKYRKGFPRWRSKKSSSEIQVYLGQLSVYLENPQNESLNEFYQQMIKVCTQMLENSPSIRPSAFMIAERVFEAQGLWEMACDCMNPWFSSGDAAIKLK
jgi:serine/threonine protein kinase